MIKLKFLGANREVTGSCSIMEYEGFKVMVDCGMYQGDEELEKRNWEQFTFDPSTVSVLLLTHAHLDHCGLIPKLVKNGFKGKIYLTAPSKDLFEITATDAAKIQKEDAINDPLKHVIYTSNDVLNSLSKCETVEYDTKIKLNEDFYVTFKQAGHILGSAILFFEVDNKKILFTGDIGHKGQTIIKPLEYIDEVDYLITESTYATRHHESKEESEQELIDVINRTVERQGNIIVPAFAIERTQELIYSIKHSIKEGKLPPLPVYLDSPMAGKATKIFLKYVKEFNPQAKDIVKKGDNPFYFPSFRIIEDARKSRRASSRNVSKNKKGESVMILAGSGMCTGGRILTYLLKNLPLSRSSIVFPGYQAEGTLGREILDGSSEVYIYDKKISVRAEIVNLEGFSAHADKTDMIDWISHMKSKPKKVFACHGDEKICLEYVDMLKEEWGIEAIAPEFLHEEIIY